MKNRERNVNLMIARMDAGMTQKELAETVKRSRLWINKLELKAVQPSKELAKQIGKALDKEPSELFGSQYEE